MSILPYFLYPIVVGICIQLIKVLIDYVIERQITFESLWRAGGFPSVHSGIAASVSTLMYFEFGMYSAEFALAFTFSFLFWYDAMNLRYQAGKHATVLNSLMPKLKKIIGKDNYNKMEEELEDVELTERLGHTFYEVAGGIIIGSLLTIVLYFLLT